MKRLKIVFQRILFSGALFSSIGSRAQNAPTATWLMPGVSYQVSSKWRLLEQFGINPSQHSQFNFAQGFYDLNKNLSLNAGYFLFRASSLNGRSYAENDALLGATLSTSAGRFVIDDRNMLNIVFPNVSQRKNFYRNRLRVTYPFSFYSHIAKVYVFDEGYYFINKGQWSRNRSAAGVNYSLDRSVSLDLSYWRQSDHYSGDINLFFVQLTLNLFHKKTVD